MPWEAVEYLAGQLSIADASCVKRYPERRSTVYEHAAEIQERFAYRDFTDGRWAGVPQLPVRAGVYPARSPALLAGLVNLELVSLCSKEPRSRSNAVGIGSRSACRVCGQEVPPQRAFAEPSVQSEGACESRVVWFRTPPSPAVRYRYGLAAMPISSVPRRHSKRSRFWLSWKWASATSAALIRFSMTNPAGRSVRVRSCSGSV